MQYISEPKKHTTPLTYTTLDVNISPLKKNNKVTVKKEMAKKGKSAETPSHCLQGQAAPGPRMCSANCLAHSPALWPELHFSPVRVEQMPAASLGPPHTLPWATLRRLSLTVVQI